jgi:hypothetical protein
MWEVTGDHGAVPFICVTISQMTEGLSTARRRGAAASPLAQSAVAIRP